MKRSQIVIIIVLLSSAIIAGYVLTTSKCVVDSPEKLINVPLANSKQLTEPEQLLEEVVFQPPRAEDIDSPYVVEVGDRFNMSNISTICKAYPEAKQIKRSGCILLETTDEYDNDLLFVCTPFNVLELVTRTFSNGSKEIISYDHGRPKRYTFQENNNWTVIRFFQGVPSYKELYKGSEFVSREKLF